MIENGYKLIHIDLDVTDLPAQTIQSTTLARVPGVRPILFKFAAGEILSEHTSSYPAVLIFLSGRAAVTLGEDHHEAGPGTWIYMPPHLPHSVTAETPVVMVLEMYA